MNNMETLGVASLKNVVTKGLANAAGWNNTLVGLNINELSQSIPGESCPKPGDIPHGDWICPAEELAVNGTNNQIAGVVLHKGKQFSQEIN